MYHAFSGHRAWMAGSTNASSQNWWSEAKKCVSCRDSLLVNTSRYFDLSSRKPNDEAVIGKACARFNNLARGIDYAIISYNSRVSWCFGKVLKVIFLFFFFWYSEPGTCYRSWLYHKEARGESLQAFAAQSLKWPSGSVLRHFIGRRLNSVIQEVLNNHSYSRNRAFTVGSNKSWIMLFDLMHGFACPSIQPSLCWALRVKSKKKKFISVWL